MPAYIVLRLVSELFRFVPFWLLYLLSDGLAFVLQRVVGYRKRVIADNLKRAFPEKNELEMRQIVRDTYRNITDVALETIKSHTTPLSEIHRRCKVLNLEIVAEYLNRGQAVILAGSHNSNWEYTGLTMPKGFPGNLYGAYKPISNKRINHYINKMRGRSGVIPVPMDEVMGVMRKQKEIGPFGFMLISDQSPSSRKRAHWVTFFGQETASLPGIDVLSRMFGFPVFSYQIRRLRRGYYELEYSPLWMNPSTAQEGEITRAYTLRLEAEIRNQPGSWLWSHKRWKMRRAE